jgi:hypothetical protein
VQSADGGAVSGYLCTHNQVTNAQAAGEHLEEIFQLVREQRRLTQARLDKEEGRKQHLEGAYLEVKGDFVALSASLPMQAAAVSAAGDPRSARIAQLQSQMADLEGTRLEKTATIDWLSDHLDEIDSKIVSLLSIEGERAEFKRTTSAIFAMLIAGVIVGFFVVTLVTRTAAEIFKRQSGLQFITLFSLVISIVLFGVLGILEGRELAALLGAISGYVLGRVSAHDVQSAFAASDGGPTAQSPAASAPGSPNPPGGASPPPAAAS